VVSGGGVCTLGCGLRLGTERRTGGLVREVLAGGVRTTGGLLCESLLGRTSGWRAGGGAVSRAGRACEELGGVTFSRRVRTAGCLESEGFTRLVRTPFWLVGGTVRVERVVVVDERFPCVV
jgi:hypothetical protein